LIFSGFLTHIFVNASELPQMAVFETDTGNHEITLEVAETEYQKTKGLMYRKTLPANAGMAFVYDMPTKAGIWMKNTFIPLDVIFVNCDDIVVDFVTKQPYTTDISVASEKICTIIEVNARLNEKISLKRGNKVHFKPPLR
jgi:uncharacterized membrane protein (UPF0127 family)